MLRALPTLNDPFLVQLLLIAVAFPAGFVVVATVLWFAWLVLPLGLHLLLNRRALRRVAAMRGAGIPIDRRSFYDPSVLPEHPFCPEDPRPDEPPSPDA